MSFSAAFPDQPAFPVPARRFLVTGATGFIGRHLAAKLAVEHGADSLTVLVHLRRGLRDEDSLAHLRTLGVAILECDLLNLPQFAPPRPQFDTLYHLAAFTETETASDECRVNSEGTRNLLEWLGPALRGRLIVYTSTVALVDPPPGHQLVNETMTPAPRTDYGRTKLLGEQAILERQVRMGFDFVILRLCTIIGPGFRAGGMFARCPHMLATGQLAARLNWPGRIAFLSLDDAVRLLQLVPDLPGCRNETFVLSNGENPTFDQLLDTMAGILGLPRRRVVLPGWFWRLVAAIAWPIAGTGWLPHGLRIFCWRITHITCDGQGADQAKLNRVVREHFQSVRDSLKVAYGK